MKQFEDAVSNYFEPTEQYTFTKHSPEQNLVATSKGLPTCEQIVYDFYFFMLGSGFGNQSVLNAFQKLHEEMTCNQTT